MKSALKDLDRIKCNPEMISADLVGESDLDGDKSAVYIENEDEGLIFGMGDEMEWGN